jgi:hypothetical protein
MFKRHGARPDLADGIGDSASRDIRCGAMDRHEHKAYVKALSGSFEDTDSFGNYFAINFVTGDDRDLASMLLRRFFLSCRQMKQNNFPRRLNRLIAGSGGTLAFLESRRRVRPQ